MLAVLVHRPRVKALIDHGKLLGIRVKRWLDPARGEIGSAMINIECLYRRQTEVERCSAFGFGG